MSGMLGTNEMFCTIRSFCEKPCASSASLFGLVLIVNVLFHEVLRTFSPYRKNVINVSQPSMGLKWGVPKSVFLKCPRKRLAKERAILVPIAVPWM